MSQLEPLILRPSKLRLILMMAGCLVFVAIGYGLGPIVLNGWKLYVWGAFSLGAFFFVLAQLITGSGTVTMDAQGFAVSSLVEPVKLSWDQIEWFGITHLSRAKVVGYNLKPEHWTKSSQSTRALVGVDGSFSDAYEGGPEAMLERLQGYSGRTS